MVHASLSSVGRVAGGANAIITALLDVLGEDGTLVMPTFRSSVSAPGLTDILPPDLIEEARALTPPYDADTTPSEMGLITETFRTWPGVLRSPHPTSSIAAHGPLAERLVARHAPAWATGRDSPFDILHEVDAQLLLLGVGFNRLSMLHYAETLIPNGRRKTRLVPLNGEVVAYPDTGDDLDTHFPKIGDAAVKEGVAKAGQVGNARCYLMASRPIVALARKYLADRL